MLIFSRIVNVDVNLDLEYSSKIQQIVRNLSMPGLNCWQKQGMKKTGL